MKAIAVILVTLLATGCATTSLNDVIIYKQSVERVEYLTSPSGQQYIIEQIRTGNRIW